MADAPLPPPPPPLISPEISLTGPAATRAVQGAVLHPLNFSATNLNAGTPTTFNLGLTSGSVGQLNSLSQPTLPSGTTVITAPATPWIGVVLNASNSGTISATPDISGLTAGQTMSFGIEASNANWTAPVSASSNINVVTQRLLTGSTTINAGRHVTGVEIGNLTLNGGAWNDSQASRITVNGGGYAQLANGLRLSSASNFTFNGVGQSSTLKVAYNGPLGDYNIAASPLPAANSYTDASGTAQHQFGGSSPSPTERINPLISGESIQGNGLNLSGVSLAVTGTAVTNRLLTGSTTINAGRHMAGLQSVGSVTLSGGAWTDSEATRISVSSGGNAQLANGLRLTSATDFTFNGANQTHDLQISYNRPAGPYSITAATLPGAGANNYTDASGNARQEFGGAWKTSAEYGNMFGQKQVFTEQNRTDWDNVSSAVWQRPGTGGYYSNDYIYNQEIAGSAQTSAPATRYGTPTTWELGRGAGPLVNERVAPLISGEVIPGSSLNLSGVSLTVTGTALENRYIYGGTIDLGRQMVGAAGQAINRSDSTTLYTYGDDDHNTHINLGAINLNNGAGSTATHTGNTLFDNGATTASVQLTGNFVRSSSTPGQNFQGVDAGASITGEGLAGESKQSSLQLGYTWNNVQNNQLVARPLLVIESSTASGPRDYSTYVSQAHYTDTHTNISWTGNSVAVDGTHAPGMINLGNTTVSAVAEGLVGENVTGPVSFNTRLATVASAAFTLTDNGQAGSPLTEGNVITLSDTGSSIYQNNVQLSRAAISGGERLDYQVAYAGGSSLLNHGSSRTLTIDYIGNTSTPAAGQLGRVSRANLSIGLSGVVNYGDIRNAWGQSGSVSQNAYGDDLGLHTYKLETRFNAPAATTGSSSVAVGTDFGLNGLTLGNTTANTSTRFTQATKMELLDSAALGSAKNVQVEFVKLADATPAVVNALENSSANAASLAGLYGTTTTPAFVSDIVNLSGLDGVMQVVQVGYDDSGVLSDQAAQLLWRYDYTGTGGSAQVAWINSVLGNSNITLLDLSLGTLSVGGVSQTVQNYLGSTRFVGSYAEYLTNNSLTNPGLGAWGLDRDNNKVWAVIDHNSSFAAAVPEPSLSIMAIIGFGCLTLRRRKN
jgi:hypothetical protein